MTNLIKSSLACVLIGFLALIAQVARAQVPPIDMTFVGTLSTPLTTFALINPAVTNPGKVARGNSYVIKVNFDPDDIVSVNAASRFFQSRNFFSVPLSNAPVGTNTFQLFFPSEGFCTPGEWDAVTAVFSAKPNRIIL